MKFLKETLIVLVTAISFLANPLTAFAATIPYTITTGIPGQSTIPGATFLTVNFNIDYQSGQMILSGNPDGTGNTWVDDAAMVWVVRRPDGSSDSVTFRYDNSCAYISQKSPQNVTYLFKLGINQVQVKLFDTCGVSVGSSSLYLVNTNAPDPTPTPSPIPIPEPFLDLPWDYEGKNFTDEVFRINSYFDHEYPLFSNEPSSTKGMTLPYYGRREPDPQTPYSGHNGYDYNLDNETAVLAAASGTATYFWDNSGGNTILINHHNGYFTWYLHLQKNDLITDIPNNPISITKGQVIGRVGSTGSFSTGPHLHLSVIKDVNNNGQFDWNIDYPFGLTDPYKWRGNGNNSTLRDDPWPLYQSGNYRGSISYYLWLKPTDSTITQIPISGGIAKLKNLSLDIPRDASSATLNFKIDEQPSSNISDIIHGLDHVFDINAFDLAGNSIKTFLQPITLIINYANENISNFIEDTLSLYYFDSEQNQWIKMPSNIDAQNKIITTQTDHLTQFAIMGELRDTISPQSYFQISGEKGQDKWYRTVVVLSIVGEDNPDGLGIKQIFYSLDDNLHWQEYKESLNFTQEGHYKIFARAIDNAGNAQTEDSILEFDIDKTPPNVSASPDRTPNNNDWYIKPLIIRFSGTDDQSGIDSCSPPITYSGPDNINTFLEGSCNDKAGNVSSATFNFKYDATSPQIFIDTNPKYLWPPNGKMVDVTVTGNSSDAHLDSTSLNVDDEYNQIEPTFTVISPDINRTIQLEARRDGGDLNGRMYIIKVSAEDLAGNRTNQEIEIIVPHDQMKER